MKLGPVSRAAGMDCECPLYCLENLKKTEQHVLECGFRRRIRDIADQVGVAGWVRNNQDDSVTVEMQGTEEQIKATSLHFRR